MNRLIKTILISLAGVQSLSMTAAGRPKLVVGIIVDQLRTDYLEDLQGMLGEGGFRKLMTQGLYMKDVNFGVVPGDASSATSIVQTGTYPRYSGVTGALMFDPATQSMRSIFSDDSFIGNFTNEKYSPAALRVSTLTDELKVEEGGNTRIHSISPDAAQAIVLAGHNGNSAFWLNGETGRWSSTTYYPAQPMNLQHKNYVAPLISRLDTMKWTPLKKGIYPYVSPAEVSEGFKYSFARSDKDVYTLYKSSPFINREITDAAIEYLKDLDLGKNNDGTDVLNIAYTLAPYPASGDSYRYELSDAYIRLDADLRRLFDAIYKYAASDDVLVYLVSTGYFAEPAVDTRKYRLPGGTFSVKRGLSLLNAYLAAKYGNGAFVDYYADSQIHLSEKTLEEKGLDLDKVAEESRDFLVRMSGIEEAYTMADLMNQSSKNLSDLRLSIDPKTSGHVILEFNPGWKVVDDSRYPTVEQVDKTSAYLAPGFIMGANISPDVKVETVEAVAIAPTISNILRIRPPNSAIAKPIPVKTK